MTSVAIDMNGALGREGGISVYLDRLIHHLPDIASPFQFQLFASYWTGFPRRSRTLPLPPGHSYRWLERRVPEKLVLPLEYQFHWRLQEPYLLRHGVQLFHGAGGLLPVTRHLKTVVTMHAYENLDGFVRGPWDRFYYDTVMRRSTQRADRVIAVSERTRDFLHQEWKIPLQRISVVYHGAPEWELLPLSESERRAWLQDHFRISRPFFLCVAHLAPRKNTVNLIHAFARFRTRTKSDVQLVLVGNRQTPYLRDVQEAIYQENLRDHVILTGVVSNEKVVQYLYPHAFGFVFPSRSESFGIPVLEAMRAGAPVIASRTTCLPEIVGEAGLLVSPEDPESIASAMARLWDEPVLRARLIELGRERVRTFTWRKTAEKTVEIYRQVLSGVEAAN